MTENKEPTAAQLRDLSERIHDTERKAKGVALWEVVQDLVGTELDNRFHEAVALQSQNTVKATLQAEEAATSDATRTVSYRMGLVVNGRELEAVVTIPMEAALMDGRHAVMDALKRSLAEQIAALLLVGFQLSGIPRG